VERERSGQEEEEEERWWRDVEESHK
jgi:hypothetical protein